MVAGEMTTKMRLSIQRLAEALDSQQNLALHLGQTGLQIEQLDYLLNMRRDLLERCCPDENIDLLEQCDREESLAAWLDTRRIPDAWEIAQPLGIVGVDCLLLSKIEQNVGTEALPHALAWLKSNLTTGELLLTMEQAVYNLIDVE